jgi:glycosyltransferase involved in cell wall biosynthesis
VTAARPKIALLYHYFHPDDVVSARHYGDLAAGLAERGWEVEAWPCNRACRDEAVRYPLREGWGDVAIRRVWRPGLRQSSGYGRVLNAAWMLARWCGVVFRSREETPDVLLVGTDPILSVLVAGVVRRLRPEVRVAHWCFDLHPEGAVADGVLRAGSWLDRALRRLMRDAYAFCDLVADLGGCMRDRLEAYGHQARKVTLVPWALDEPARPEAADPVTRRELFGDRPLGLLYSGNFGRAHSYAEFLELARRLRGDGVQFCFGVRGNRADELRAAVRPDDTNVGFAGFAPEAELGKRLAAADVHLASLRPEWTGLVVPSKFFGSLAAGRPVLFAGARDACIARWIREHGVGWVLDADSTDSVAGELRRLSADRAALAALQQRCWQVYQDHFSRQRTVDAWDRELSRLVAPRASREGLWLAGATGQESADLSEVTGAHDLA